MIFNSIRARLQIWYGLILLVILAGFGLTAWQLERGQLFGRVHSELDRRAGFLVTAVHPRPGGPDRGGPNRGGPDRGGPDQGGPGSNGQDFNGPDFNGPDRGGPPIDRPRPGESPDDRPPGDQPGPPQDLRLPPEMAGLFDAGDPNHFYFIIYDREGRELRRSTNAPAQPLVTPADLPPRPEGGRRPEGAGGPPARVYRSSGDRMELGMPTPMGGSIHVGASLAPELKELRGVAFQLVLVGAGILLLGLGGGWWLTGRAIRPIADISATAVQISGGDLSRRISLTETGSEFGRLAGVLNSTFARLEAAFAQQKQFASDAAHELRTPVSVLLTQTQLSLSRERSPAEYRQTVESCQRAAQRMRRLIESLLALARLDAGQEPMKRMNFDLADLARDCAGWVRPLAEARGLTLVLEPAPAPCVGDSERLGQVLTNLLTNAIEYNRPNGEVRVTTAAAHDTAILTIRDTGAGIAPADLPRVFERFYRSDQSRTSGGNGLGLSICKAIVDAHGGSIEAASELNVGTTFTVRLPAR
jgi:heavy metal sensor kinase